MVVNLLWYKRIISGPDAGAFYNRFFLRGYPEEMAKMVRIKIKGNRTENPSEYLMEPDFYSMLLLPPTAEPHAMPLLSRGCSGLSLSSTESSNHFQQEMRLSEVIAYRALETERDLSAEMCNMHWPTPIRRTSMCGPCIDTDTYICRGVPSTVNKSFNCCESMPPRIPSCQNCDMFSICDKMKVTNPDAIEPLSFKNDVSDDDLVQCIDYVMHVL